jgi:hypothetical protein
VACLDRVIVSVCKTIASFQDMLLMDLYSGALCVDALSIHNMNNHFPGSLLGDQSCRTV